MFQMNVYWKNVKVCWTKKKPMKNEKTNKNGKTQ